jgi:OOP family OmpA-OmpF porin
MKKGVVAALAIAAAATAAPAAAQDKGIYLGGSVGYSQYQDVCQNLTIPCKDDTTAWRAFAGYQFHQNWAAEFGYGLLGKAEGNGLFGGGTGSFVQKSKGWDVSILGSFEILRRLTAFGRLGAYSARTTLDQEVISGGTTTPFNDADSQSGVTYGAGIAYNLSHIGVRLEWQRYDNIGMNSFGHDDLDVFSLGLLLRF